MDKVSKRLSMRICFDSLLNYYFKINNSPKFDSETMIIDYDWLLVNFCCAYLTTEIDKYFYKTDKNNTEFLLPSEFMDQIASRFAIKGKEGWRVDNQTFENSGILLKKVRDKLAHGDYYVLKGYIVIEEQTTKYKINVMDFVNAMLLFNKLLLEEKNAKNLPKRTYNYKFHTCLKSKNGISQPLDEIYSLDLKISNKNETNDEHFKLIASSIAQLFQKYFQGSRRQKEEIDQDLKNLTTVAMENPTIDVSYKTYFAKLDSSKELFNQKKQNILNDDNNFSLVSGIIDNINIIKFLKSNPQKNINDYLIKNPEAFIKDDYTLAAVLQQFYSAYQYGLEKGYSDSDSSSIEKIINGEYLDFSLLDLDDLYDENMEMDYKLNGNLDEVNKLTKLNKDDLKSIFKGIQKLKGIIEHRFFMNNQNDFCIKLEKKLDNLEEKHENLQYLKVIYDIICAYFRKIKVDEKNRITLSLINNCIGEFYIKYDKYYKDFENKSKIDKYIKDGRKSLYIRNYKIITHIRNAYSHGLIKVISINESNDKMVLIIDKDEQGKIVYQKKILFSRLCEILFSFQNLDVVNVQIANNIMDTTLSELEQSEFVKNLIKLKNNNY